MLKGLLLMNVVIGRGVVLSIPAMKKSVKSNDDLLDDVISSIQCVVHAFSRTIGSIAGGYFNILIGFEATSAYLGLLLLAVSIPYFLYQFYSLNPWRVCKTQSKDVVTADESSHYKKLLM